ncbi:TPA: hypothetical protein P2N00_000495 [Aeromonas salmonicida]|uniref:Uncharacterized protein n=1 Tax=Aeromonas salmonicida subsp. salmonicida TaxID=29491 RepID=A0A0A7KW13_AERSS|nr:hypothetical protein [Aeromonas salmonicida]AIZ49636.1 hypothetical protein [Aeromonas salmonicida subsp. salmonicida]OAH88265.1 hypothetical protein AXW79_01390 [Aeromonas salmonicida subsp. salmonicida]OKA78049.1 hypothetical protein BHR41_02435 [Aeromonas salmonicida subsp. salmonicida]SPT73627.1 Uncharacterised protein [Aeromonas salmonicida]HDN9784858.1 hypothetical protein [Aeromonas salmonicida]
MSRAALPDHENMSTISPLRLRGTPAQREVWREVAAEFCMTETAFARVSLLTLLNSISQHEPEILARAVKRASRILMAQGYPPATIEEILSGYGLPEYGKLAFTPDDEAAYENERHKTPVEKLKVEYEKIRNLVNSILRR